MKRDINAYVEGRLQQWAEWHTRNNDNGIGYRRQSNEYLIMRDKGVMIKGTTQFYLPTNNEAEEIERLICEFAQYSIAHGKMADALVQNYCYRGSVKQKAKDLGYTRSYFLELVGRARQWVEGRLSLKWGR